MEIHALIIIMFLQVEYPVPGLYYNYILEVYGGIFYTSFLRQR